jgi:glutamate synthase domain-containing protein 1
MLQSMKHRGPDSTGYALYAKPTEYVVMRYTVANTTTPRDYEFQGRLKRNRAEVESRLARLDAKIVTNEQETDYAFRVTLDYSGELKNIADQIEDIPDCEVLSLGHSLEIIKDLGDAETVC